MFHLSIWNRHGTLSADPKVPSAALNSLTLWSLIRELCVSKPVKTHPEEDWRHDCASQKFFWTPWCKLRAACRSMAVRQCSFSRLGVLVIDFSGQVRPGRFLQQGQFSLLWDTSPIQSWFKFHLTWPCWKEAILEPKTPNSILQTECIIDLDSWVDIK